MWQIWREAPCDVSIYEYQTGARLRPANAMRRRDEVSMPDSAIFSITANVSATRSIKEKLTNT